MKKYEETELMNMPWIANDGKGRYYTLPQELYAYLKKQLCLKITNAGNFYMFNGKYYEQLTTQTIKAIIKQYLPVLLRNKKQWEAVYEEFRTDFPDLKESDFDSNEDIIVFNNGVLNIKTNTFEKHNSKNLVTRIMDAKYDSSKTLDNTPIFHNFLNTLFSDDEETINYVLCYMGAIFSNVYGYRFKSLLMLYGPGNTGKSVFRELIISLIGEDNNASISINRMQERFGTAALYRKRLAGCGDMEFLELKDVDILKSLTGGDTIFAEFKGKNPFYFKYKGLLLLVANELPYFRGDRGDHVYERMNIIKCNNVIPFEQRDQNLLDKMLKEKDAIVSVAVNAFMKMLEKGYQLPVTAQMIMQRKEYSITNNSLYSFVKEYCCLFDGETVKSDFHAVYKLYCLDNRVNPERIKDIPILLDNKFGITQKKSRGNWYYTVSFNDKADEYLEKVARARESYSSKYYY